MRPKGTVLHREGMHIGIGERGTPEERKRTLQEKKIQGGREGVNREGGSDGILGHGLLGGKKNFKGGGGDGGDVEGGKLLF